jgi:hypothetical protein
MFASEAVMNLLGIPDFQAPMPDGAFQVLRPFLQEGAPAFLVPDALDVARDRSGLPEIRLRKVRPVNPMLPPEPYALFDLSLVPVYPFERGLEILRALFPEGRLEPVAFRSGYLRLTPHADAAGFPEALAVPSPLAWNGLANAHYGIRLGLEGAAFLESLLVDGALAVSARAEMEIAGVSQRDASTVHFDPAALVAGLSARADERGRIPREKILAILETDPGTLGFAADRVRDDRRAFALALMDRIRSRMAVFTPAPGAAADGDAANSTYLTLTPEAAGAGSGRATWDLAEPELTFRPLVLTMNPLDAARAAIADSGLEVIVPAPVIVPPIAAGVHSVSITANLPENRPGVPAVGVTLRAPPAPPARPQAQIASAELTPPDDAAVVALRLAPTEPLRYLYRTFVMVEEDSGPRRIEGEELESRDTRLRLSVDDFPVRFIVVEAGQDLREMAEIGGSCRWSTGEISFFIGPSARETSIPLPREAVDPVIEVHVRPREAGGVLTIGPLPARSLHLGLPSFPEYGPHVIRVACAFEEATPGSMAADLVALDLVPEGREGESGAVGILAFTRAQPSKEWRYLSSSPFRAGYRYRIRSEHDAGQLPPWSELQSPFVPLSIDARVHAGRSEG